MWPNRARSPEDADQLQFRLRLGGAALVLVAGLVTLTLLAGGRPIDGAGTFGGGGDDSVAEALPALAGFVEQQRGLRFTRLPTVDLVDDATFARVLAEPTPRPAGQGLPDRARTLAALGIPPAGTAPGLPGSQEDTAGHYSPATKKITLPASRPFDVAARVVLVHQLTHALLDQNFPLTGTITEASLDTDRLRALGALIDGDATRIELAYLATLPEDEAAGVQGRFVFDPKPTTYADQERYFATSFGRDFVEMLLSRGGRPLLDAAYRQPPTASAQIIDPRKYIDGVGPVGLSPVDSNGTRLDGGTFGQFGLAMLVSGGKRLINISSTSEWLGDTYGTFKSGPSGACVRLNIVLADSSARDGLGRDLVTWVASRKGKALITRSADRGLRIVSCT